jgi:small neutral amino acid transporter SnatA (MarC family)
MGWDVGGSRLVKPVLAWSLATVAVLGLTRSVVALPEHCAVPSAAELGAGIDEAVAWFSRNQQPDGTWLYRFDVETGEDLGGYNWVRHAGVLLSLEQAATAGDEEARVIADRGWPPLLERFVRHGDQLALDNGDFLTTGGTSLAVVALGERRVATDEPIYDDELRDLGRFLRQQVGADGTVDEDADIATGARIAGTPSPFSTGEAMFALARLERLFPGEGWGDDARRIGRYVAFERADREGYVPDVSDHWAAYALSEITRWDDPDGRRLLDHELAFSRRQMGIVSIEIRYESQRTNGGIDRYLRGRTSKGAGLGTLGEASGAFGVVAAAEPRLAGVEGGMADRQLCAADLLLDRQIDPAEAAVLPDPAASRGAWTQFGITQMDDQQHALSALLAATSRRADIDQIPRRSPVPTAAWLVVVAAAAALNPARLAVRGPRRRAVRATGAGSAAVVLGVLAAVGGPVLRALDVSTGTAVVGAGAAVAVLGLLTTLRSATTPIPGVGGWRDAVVPAALPLTLRPDLILLALACGAGGRGWVLLAGVVAAIMVGVVLPGTGESPENLRTKTLWTWGVRLGAVVALATGIALIVDGVYAV